MSELTGKFLAQLKNDIALLANDDQLAASKLRSLAERVDVDDTSASVPLSIDKEKGRMLIHTRHPAVDKLLNNPQRRRSDLLFFVSSMMSLLNREEEGITDEHEREFHARLLQFALNDCHGSWAGSV